MTKLEWVRPHGLCVTNTTVLGEDVTRAAAFPVCGPVRDIARPAPLHAGLGRMKPRLGRRAMD